jgi:uncharacterized protein (TIGR00299 family) protein
VKPILYLDCTAGAAGDMILAALVDAGAPLDYVRSQLDTLGLDGWDLRTETVTRAGIRGTRVHVELEGSSSDRNHGDIVQLLQAARLDDNVRELSLRAFDALATAEAHVHGTAKDDVHFHEVGALDSIVDTVGACAAFAALSPERVICSPVAVGSGTVNTRHGPMPVPVPAVTELLRGVPIVGRGEFETITPTGAALLMTLADSFGEMPAMTLQATGYGAGARDVAYPNVVRALLGIASQVRSEDDALLAETNIDDMNPELVPYVIEMLLAAGAQDAWASPAVMKKGRLATTLSVLYDRDDEDRILDILYRETTTLGVRITPVRKNVLAREWVETEVEGHPIRVKIASRGGVVVTAAPEYEDAAAVARATGMPLKDVYARALASVELTRERNAPQLP